MYQNCEFRLSIVVEISTKTQFKCMIIGNTNLDNILSYWKTVMVTPLYRSITFSIVGLFVCLLSCDSLEQTDESENPSLSPPPNEQPVAQKPAVVFRISGRLVTRGQIEQVSEHLSRAQVWIFNHKHLAVEILRVDGDGNFEIPLSFLDPQGQFSIHLLRNDGQYLGLLDLNPDEDEQQGGFRLQGENRQVDLGQILVSVDGFGVLEASQSLVSTADHGLVLDSSFTTDLSQVKLPSSIAAVSWTEQLTNLDSISLLQLFQRQTNPEVYLSQLKRWSAHKISVEPAQAGAFSIKL